MLSPRSMLRGPQFIIHLINSSNTNHTLPRLILIQILISTVPAQQRASRSFMAINFLNRQEEFPVQIHHFNHNKLQIATHILLYKLPRDQPTIYILRLTLTRDLS